MGAEPSKPAVHTHAISSPPGRRSLLPSTSQRFRAIADNFATLEQVQAALRKEGLESSNLIVAVDFTKSNEWTGKHSFGGRSLHALNSTPGAVNPYEHAISIIGRTLQAFDDDGLIPCYGFGDARTQDSKVFSFLPGDAPCVGLDTVCSTYRQLVPTVKLAGPTSFAPAILQAMKIVAQTGQYHILLIVADGQVTRSSDMLPGQLSAQEQATINAIVAASELPLSIVMVGVGDGPWDVMREFDDALPARRFDNFQFVNFTDLAHGRYASQAQMEAQFALRALMEVPEQYKIIQQLGMLGRTTSLRIRIPPTLDPPGPSYAPPPAAYPQQPNYPQPGGTIYPPQGGPPGGYPPQGYPAQGPPGYPQNYPPGSYPAPDQAATGFSGYPSFGAGQGAAGAAGGGVGAGQYPNVAGGAPSFGRLMSRGRGVGVDPLFVCPITQEVMLDPVIAADGHTYERSAIGQWLATHNTSPMTSLPLEHKNLTPNHALRSTIMEALQGAGAPGVQ